jgi:hypothetical protein
MDGVTEESVLNSLDFLYFSASSLTVQPIQPPTQWVQRALTREQRDPVVKMMISGGVNNA